jgi:hypothetical protein
MRFYSWLTAALGAAGATLLPLAATAQTPVWHPATTIQSLYSGANLVASAADAAGNVYVLGDVYGTLTFGTSVVQSTGPRTMYVAKWSKATGSFSWAQQIYNTSYTDAVSLAVQGSSIYVVGQFEGTARFGSTTLTSAGGADGFVAKLTDAGSSGSFTWARQLSGPATDQAQAVAVAGSSVYLTGSFTSSVLQVGSALTLAGAGAPPYATPFVAKIIDAGASAEFTWAVAAVGTSSCISQALAVAGSSVYVGGYFFGQCRFGATTLDAGNSSSGFVAKLTDAGNAGSFVWARQSTGPGAEEVRYLAVEDSRIFAAGSYGGGPVSFGSTTLAPYSTAGVTYQDTFVAKLTDAGATADFTWAQAVGGLGYDYPAGLAVQGSAVYLAGSTSSPDLHLGPLQLTSRGTTDGFVARLTDLGAAGLFTWADLLTSAGENRFYSLATAGPGEVYLTGDFTPAARLGTLTLGTAGESKTTFLVSFTDPAPVPVLALALYPNPARHRATLLVPPTAGSNSTTLQLYDTVGRLVQHHSLPVPAVGLRTELNLDGLAGGVYALRVSLGRQQAVLWLAVQ